MSDEWATGDTAMGPQPNTAPTPDLACQDLWNNGLRWLINIGFTDHLVCTHPNPVPDLSHTNNLALCFLAYAFNCT
eukprot:1139251-Pelagomonas_calceolata.AAC.8